MKPESVIKLLFTSFVIYSIYSTYSLDLLIITPSWFVNDFVNHFHQDIPHPRFIAHLLQSIYHLLYHLRPQLVILFITTIYEFVLWVNQSSLVQLFGSDVLLERETVLDVFHTLLVDITIAFAFHYHLTHLNQSFFHLPQFNLLTFDQTANFHFDLHHPKFVTINLFHCFRHLNLTHHNHLLQINLQCSVEQWIVIILSFILS